MRAAGIANADGKVHFTTIYPGCYMGRVPHIHFEVYPSIDAAQSFDQRALCSQIAFPDDISTAIYNSVAEYADSIKPFNQISLSTDNVFSDNSEAEIEAQTLALEGSIQTGFQGRLTIALDPTAKPKASSPGGRSFGPPPDGDFPFDGPTPPIDQ